MHITDPIADMLTRIRNANNARHESVDIPASKMKKAIADILVREGYVKSAEVIDDGIQGVIRVTLKYAENKQKVLTGLKRVCQSPVLEFMLQRKSCLRVLKGLGIAIISTSKGVMTDKEARKSECWRRSTGIYLVRKEENSLSRIGNMPITVPAGVDCYNTVQTI